MRREELERKSILCRAGADAMERVKKALLPICPTVSYVTFQFFYSSGDGGRFEIDIPLTDKGYDFDAVYSGDVPSDKGEFGDKRKEAIRALIDEFDVIPTLKIDSRWTDSFQLDQTGWIQFLIGEDVILIVRNAPLPFKLKNEKKETLSAVMDNGELIEASSAPLNY